MGEPAPLVPQESVPWYRHPKFVAGVTIAGFVLGVLCPVLSMIPAAAPAAPWCAIAQKVVHTASTGFPPPPVTAEGEPQISPVEGCSEGRTRVGAVGVCVCVSGQWVTYPAGPDAGHCD